MKTSCMLVCKWGNQRWGWLFFSLLAGMVLLSCASLPGETPPVGDTDVAVAKVHWCGRPLMVFRDESANATATAVATAAAQGLPVATVGTATTLSDWAQVEPKLGFTVYLPSTVPSGTCLMNASSTLHDPIFGSSFTIGYLLPDHSALTLSQAPLHAQHSDFQCSVSSDFGSTAKAGTPTVAAAPGQPPTQLCSGGRDKTNIVFSARGTVGSLKKFFDTLQSGVQWIPAS